MKYLVTTSALAISVFGSSFVPAYAQQGGPAAPETLDSAEIIVTANKREQNIQDVPVAVTAVSDAKLKSLNVVAIQDITSVAPSITFQEAPSPTQSSFNIRGIGTFAFNDALEQSVGVVIDGVPQARVIGSLGDAVDVGAVQILRGPQGTLFGKNATAGAIDVSYRDAILNKTSLEGRFFYGSYDEIRAQATVNLPLGEAAALRLSGWKFSRNGYIRAPLQPDRNIGDFNRYGGRAKLALTPTDTWRVDITAEVKRETNDGSLQTIRGYLTDPASVPRETVIKGINESQGIFAGPNNLQSGKDFPEKNTLVQKRGVIKSVLGVGDHSLTAVLGASKTNFNGIWDSDFTDSRTFSQGSVINNRLKLRQFTGELRLASESKSPFQYTVGLFFYDFDSNSHFDSQNLKTDTPLSQGTSTDILVDLHTRNYAAFADGTYELGKLILMAGGRLSSEKTTGLFNRGPSAQFIQPNILFGAFQTSNKVKYDDFSYRLGAQFRATEDIMIYAAASRGYKGPGFNYVFTLNQSIVNANGVQIRPEIAKNYEIGLRSEWFDRQLRLNLTGFYSPFSDFQVTSIIPTTPPTFSTTNAPEVTAKGIELEFGLAPRALRGLTIEGSVVYNDTKYTDFRNAPCYNGQLRTTTPTSAAGVCAPIATGSSVFVQNVTGLRTVGSPPWQVRLTTRYDTKINDKVRVFGQVNYNYMGKQQFEVGNPSRTIQPGYSIVDLTAGIGTADEKLLFSVYARNLFDKRYISRVLFSNPGLQQTVPFGALQTFGASVDFRF